jgi:hypothetical protein
MHPLVVKELRRLGFDPQPDLLFEQWVFSQRGERISNKRFGRTNHGYLRAVNEAGMGPYAKAVVNAMTSEELASEQPHIKGLFFQRWERDNSDGYLDSVDLKRWCSFADDYYRTFFVERGIGDDVIPEVGIHDHDDPEDGLACPCNLLHFLVMLEYTGEYLEPLPPHLQ